MFPITSLEKRKADARKADGNNPSSYKIFYSIVK
jgi:hypothetical protein